MPQEWWTIVQTGNCGDNQMLRDGTAWRFEGAPVPDWKYLQAVSKEMLNCVYGEVWLEEIGENHEVWSASGRIADTKETGYAISH